MTKWRVGFETRSKGSVGQRKWGKPRAALVYLAREWGRASVKEIGRRLHRDPSIISWLYSAYAANRDRNKEKLLAKQLGL